jgi:hypothetical protein
MTNMNETGLTEKQVKLIAFEVEGVDTYSPTFMEELSYRVQGFVTDAMLNSSNLTPSYICRRCRFLVYGA